MILLDTKKITNDRSETVDQVIRRASKLNQEEVRLAKMINDARDKAKETIKEINKEFEDYEEQIIIKTARLTQKIDALEDKRKKLLEPINDIRLEAESYFEDAKEELKKVEAEKINNANISQKNDVLKTLLENKEKSLNDRESDIIIKENINKKKEEDLVQSENVLKINWIKYKKSVDKLNIKVSQLIIIEDTLRVENEAIKDRKESLDKLKKQLIGEKRGLNSERQAIGQAKIHLGIRS
jgi:hypothetical protein